MKVLVYMFRGLIDKVVDVDTGQEIDFEEVETFEEVENNDCIESIEEV